ncbi:MAG: PAS domain-containing protein, partial [Halomonas sp.]|nr:PAS domain-containing protein [Halomonas sp.]
MPATSLQLLPRFLDAMLCASPAVVYATAPEWWQGRLHYLGVNVKSLCGIDREWLVEHPARWLELMTAESRQGVLDQLETACQSLATQVSLHYTLRHRDGTLHHLQDDIVIHRNDEGGVTELVGSLVDVTAHRTMLQRFEKLGAHLPGTLYQCRMTPDGRVSFPLVSSGVRRLFGMSAEAVIDNAEVAFDHVHPDDLDGLWRSIRRSATRLT